jgi:tetratricopeptide (TPR) repeat protein
MSHGGDPRRAQGQQRRPDRRTRPPRPPAPTLPDGIRAADLAPEVRAELREFPPDRRDVLAAHLVAVGALLSEDPDAAYDHAAYARSAAPRLPSVREAAGIASYRTGRYAEALADLRTYARMTGDDRHLPVMADCERGLGRPERALALARGPKAAALRRGERIELRIVAAGARRDLGDAGAALVELRGPELDAGAGPETARLWYAYADALLALDRREEAAQWFAAAASADEDADTDAEQRLAEIREPTEPT